MLTLFTMLFSRKNIGSTILVIGLIIAGIIFLPKILLKQKPSFKPIHPSSLLKRIEHMEHLKLSTYFFEEIITIGTPRRVKKIVDRKLDEVELAKTILQDRTEYMLRQDSIVMSYSQGVSATDTTLLRMQQDLDQATIVFQEMKRSNVDYYSEGLRTAFDAYMAVNDSVVAKPWEDERARIKKQTGKKRLRKPEREIVNAIEDKLKKHLAEKKDVYDLMFKREKDQRRQEVNNHMKAIKERQKLSKSENADLKKEKKDAEKELDRAHKLLEDAQKDLENKERKLAEVQQELQNVLLNGEDVVKPELLIIVPAEVSAYIDLRELRIGDRILGDTLQVLMPIVQLDSVIIDLDSTAEFFDIGRRELTLSTSSVYYEVYEQLRDGIKETEAIVKQKAKKAGIYDETQKLAYRYIKDFASTLGYNVQIVDSLGEMIAPAPIFDPDLEEDNMLMDKVDLAGSVKEAKAEENSVDTSQNQ